jgi:hypothetical protein
LQDDFRALAVLAPFLVVLFMAALGGVLVLSGVRLRLESYLLTGFGLALFYPMLTFLSGILPLAAAAALAVLLVSGLLLGFLARAVGGKPILARAGLLLAVFLGFLSLGMLTPWRGLLLTAGALLLLAMFMLLYARRARAPEPETIVEPEMEESPTPEAEPEREPGLEPGGEFAQTVAAENVVAPPGEPYLHCPFCGRALEEDYAFCPACGHETTGLRRCDHCGHEGLVTAGLEAVHCVRCGSQLRSRSAV